MAPCRIGPRRAGSGPALPRLAALACAARQLALLLPQPAPFLFLLLSLPGPARRLNGPSVPLASSLPLPFSRPPAPPTTPPPPQSLLHLLVALESSHPCSSLPSSPSRLLFPLLPSSSPHALQAYVVHPTLVAALDLRSAPPSGPSHAHERLTTRATWPSSVFHSKPASHLPSTTVTTADAPCVPPLQSRIRRLSFRVLGFPWSASARFRFPGLVPQPPQPRLSLQQHVPIRPGVPSSSSWCWRCAVVVEWWTRAPAILDS